VQRGWLEQTCLRLTDLDYETADGSARCSPSMLGLPKARSSGLARPACPCHAHAQLHPRLSLAWPQPATQTRAAQLRRPRLNTKSARRQPPCRSTLSSGWAQVCALRAGDRAGTAPGRQRACATGARLRLCSSWIVLPLQPGTCHAPHQPGTVPSWPPQSAPPTREAIGSTVALTPPSDSTPSANRSQSVWLVQDWPPRGRGR